MFRQVEFGPAVRSPLRTYDPLLVISPQDAMVAAAEAMGVATEAVLLANE
jgi:hypothetical protein